MQIKEINCKPIEIIETAPFFKKTDDAFKHVPVNRDVWFIIQDYTRYHGAMTNCIIHRAIEKFGPERIVIVVASGMHRASSQSEMNIMLGSDITQRLRVYTHNPLQTFKFPVNVYRIAIHNTTPHNFIGISHAGKMLMPGLLNAEDARKWHKDNRYDSKRETEQAGYNFDSIFDYCLDADGNFINYYVGNNGTHYEEYLKRATKMFEVAIPYDKPDVVILKPKYKIQDFILMMNAMTVCGGRQMVRKGGTICIESSRPDHIGTHYLFQQYNGLTPAYYDEVFKATYRDANIAFITPNLNHQMMQDYFNKTIFQFKVRSVFDMFIESLYGEDATINIYHGSDMMIGVDE